MRTRIGATVAFVALALGAIATSAPAVASESIVPVQARVVQHRLVPMGSLCLPERRHKELLRWTFNGYTTTSSWSKWRVYAAPTNCLQ